MLHLRSVGRQFRIPLIVSTFCLFAAAVAAMSFYGGLSALASGSMPPPAGPPRVSETPVHARHEGLPAIQPRAGCPATGAISVPCFTEADARQWVAAHRLPATVPGTADPVVTSVQFLPSRAVSAQLQGESTGVPDDYLLCLVRLSGTFRSTWGPAGATPQVFHEGVIVFDSQTGNLLFDSVE